MLRWIRRRISIIPAAKPAGHGICRAHKWLPEMLGIKDRYDPEPSTTTLTPFSERWPRGNQEPGEDGLVTASDDRGDLPGFAFDDR